MRIADKAATEHQFYRYEAARLPNQYMEIQDPASLDLGIQADRTGDVVVFQGHLRGGVLWGPFENVGAAESFGSALRVDADDGNLDFHVFELANKQK